MTETTNLQQDNQDMQRDNYRLVETHRRPETDKDSRACCCCRCCCLKFLKFWIGCWYFFVGYFRKYCCPICCCICHLYFLYRLYCCFRCHFRRYCQVAVVQIFIPESTSKPIGFSSAISRFCKEISYTCQLCDNVELLKEELPLVVVCQISTRFGADVDLVLSGIRWTNTFVVLLLHCGSESSLPILPTADELANKKKYHYVKFIDVAYDIDSKLYQCEMNKTAKRQLETFLKDLNHNIFNI